MVPAARRVYSAITGRAILRILVDVRCKLMAIANFEQLCGAFCEMAGIETPTLAPDAHGSLAFTVRVRGVLVSALQVQGGSDTAIVLAELGAMPESHGIDGWLTLLKMNMQLQAQDLPVFSRNPGNGEVVLQQALPLWRASPALVFERIEMLVDMAQQWREGCFEFDEAVDRPDGPLPALLDAMA